METPRQRVNASMIPSNQGKVVCLLGLAHSVDPNGMSFQMKTSDNQDIKVNMQEPLQEYVDGLTEVYGMVEGNNDVTCYNYVGFDPAANKDFDMDSYNRAITLAAQLPDHYIQGIRS